MTPRASPPVPEDVQAILTRYLDLIDEALPGRLTGLYLVGSLALNDYRPGQSDVDFVALTGSRLTPTEMDRLETVHQTLLTELGRPWFDGIYVTSSDLARNPEEVESAPHSHEGQFRRERGFEVNPAAWLTLRNHALPIRGQTRAIWHDPDALCGWTFNNLNSYWSDTATQLERAASRLAGEAASQAILWCVSGVLRLAYTLATGDITSKSGACRYALTAYPEQWHSIVLEALAIRDGAPRPEQASPTPIEDTVAFMRHVIQTESARQQETSVRTPTS